MVHLVREYDDRPVASGFTGLSVIAQLLYALGTFIVVMLVLRFLLTLFGANPANGFASFVYNVSRPFVQPFFGLFSYSPNLGIARFEFETLIALAVYALLTWAVANMVSPYRRY